MARGTITFARVKVYNILLTIYTTRTTLNL